MASAESPTRPRVAIVGTGIGGLTAAYLLGDDCDVTLIEHQSVLGMDAASRTYAGARMDVPLRTFQEDFYANLSSIYRTAGIEYGQADYSYTIWDSLKNNAFFEFTQIIDNPLLTFFGISKIRLPSLNTLLSPSFYKNAYYYYMRYMRHAREDLESGSLHDITFKEYVLTRLGLPYDFYVSFFMPMLSVICTADFESVGNYPAEVLVDYTCGYREPYGYYTSDTMRVIGGTKDVVDRLSKKAKHILLSTKVVGLSRSSAKEWLIETVDATDIPKAELFAESKLPDIVHSKTKIRRAYDHVILATQADAALRIVGDAATAEERDALSSFTYTYNSSVLHTDDSFMPPQRRYWNSAVLTLRESEQSECTIWMNKVDSHLGKSLQLNNVFQTWNPTRAVDPSKCVVEYKLPRPVLTLDSEAGMDLLEKVNGARNLWFVGAYALYSMPLLENGARSAIRVAKKLANVGAAETGRQITGAAFKRRRPDLVPDECDIIPTDLRLRRREETARRRAWVTLGAFLVAGFTVPL